MGSSAVPPRLPIGEHLTGVVIRRGDPPRDLLLIGIDPPADAQMIASTTLIVRYGIRFLGKPHLSIVPGLVAVDYGTFLNAEEAWEFLVKGSNLYPRAEIFGYRNDGLDDQQYVKTLDFALPFEPLLYTSEAASVPIAKPVALIAPEGTELTPRLKDNLPRFRTLAEWEAQT